MEAAETPIVVGDLVLPKLTIRNVMALAAKYQAKEAKRIRDEAAALKVSPEATVRLVNVSIPTDYGQAHVWDYATTFEGSYAICVASLVQAGTKKEDAETALDKLTASVLQDAALEVVEHPNSPRRIAQRQAEAKTENPQSAA